MFRLSENFRIGILCFGMLAGVQPARAQKAVLVEEAGRGVPTAVSSSSLQRDSSLDSSDAYESAIHLRSQRRVGVGLVAAGKMGLFGAVVELNYSPVHAALVGFGGGPGYSSLLFEYKRHFSGRAISPYLSFGYSRWSSAGKKQEISSSTPSFLFSRFLSSEEKSSGVFAKDLLTPSVGLQYNQLFGRAVGASIYAEIVFLTTTQNFDFIPTGSVGFLQYF